MVKEYTCEKCGKVFTQKGHFMNHQKRKRPCKPIENKVIEEKVQQKLQELSENGEIEIATNMEWYAHEAIDYLKNDFKMSLINHKTLDKNITNYRTHFESKYIKSGNVCHNMLFSR